MSDETIKEDVDQIMREVFGPRWRDLKKEANREFFGFCGMKVHAPKLPDDDAGPASKCIQSLRARLAAKT